MSDFKGSLFQLNYQKTSIEFNTVFGIFFIKTQTMKLVYLFTFYVFILACNPNAKTEIIQTKTENIQLEKVCLENPFTIGTANEIEFYEGGFSGLTAIPNSQNEFLSISDRGPNLEFKADSIETEIKVFPFPNYHPKIFRLQLNKNELQIVDTISLKNFDGKPLVGLPAANLTNQAKEIAWENTDGLTLQNSPNGIDAEAISIDANGDYWIVEEYQSSLWKIDPNTGIVLQKFTPQQSLVEHQNTYSLPEVFQFRKPNRGFESVSVTPNGNVWSILQSPAWYPSKELVKEGRLIRMLQLNPETKESFTFLYEHDQEEGIRQKDWKIGDMTAISNTEFVTIEHASYQGKRFMRIYKVDVSDATEIQANQKFNNKTPEELLTAVEAEKNGLKVVQKTLIMDLVDNGFDPKHVKPEGVTMLNETTMVIVNDNDYAIEFNEDKSAYINNKVKSCLYLYTLPKSIQAY